MNIFEGERKRRKKKNNRWVTNMHQHDDAVPRQPQVRLDGVRAGLDRAAERLHGVLGGYGAVAAMRDGLGEAVALLRRLLALNRRITIIIIIITTIITVVIAWFRRRRNALVVRIRLLV